MNKTLKIILILVVVILLMFVLKYFVDANSKDIEEFSVAEPFYTSINSKAVATGKLNPEEEIELKPQISGIVDEIVVEEGDRVKKGDLVAKIRVVPNEQSLANAQSRIATAKLAFENAKTQYQRDKKIFEKGVISIQTFENSELSYNQARESLVQAQNDYQIIKRGSLSGGSTANTNIIAQISGTILEIPVREGDQVIQSNNFNAGTTIATLADMSNMIFEGKVDEAEVGKLEEGRDITVILGAINDKEFPAKLTFVAPKGKEENGAVQFTVKANVMLDTVTNVRAGYSANAEIDIEGKDSVLAIKEALLQYRRQSDKPFVEVQDEDGNFKRKNVKLGVSDGINVEIIEGVEEGDKIKVWNKASEEEEEEMDDDKRRERKAK
ncbi:efflux RND transporter periplasmic adaptor subunit [Hyunsoonleella sp. SJ7]|uniref:Efflux RND transporter periplasmic adaptor subunit n=1 Tax=Hyunsoonleella aquatilis TaxID=2762758 RepID=A0A923KJ47_9FLAO|nr:efflux RND transporter periplasmic adaptor subunit [Hyunsoonleella aquatilis]MBC3756907.1 efflux RND transporter periplasmic adaptor subunit [Hyunsoonleella aquatilis]